MSISPERLDDIKFIPDSDMNTLDIPELNDESLNEAQLKRPQAPQTLSELLAQVMDEPDWGEPMGQESW